MPKRAPDVPAEKAINGGGRHHRYVFFAVASLALFMSSAGATIVATALPVIEHNLQADLVWTGWIITAYQLVLLTTMPLVGRISDEWGRKRVFMGCVIIFTLGSLFCALSPNIFWLIAARFFQALGGGGFMPSAMGIVGDHFAEDRARAIGLFTSVFPLGGIVGPALGGWLLDYTPWHTIFLINIPVGVVVLILSHLLLEPDPAARRTRVDLPGASLFAVSILFLMYFLTRIGENPAVVFSGVTWILLALGILLLLAFLRWEKRVESPVLELSLLKNPTFAVINGLNLLYGACILGMMAFIPYYAQLVYGMSSLAGGSLLTARALGMIGMSALVSMILNRTGYRLPMTAGFLVLAASTLGLAFLPHGPVIGGRALADYWWLAFLVFVSGVGVGLASPPSNNAAIELMPEKIAAISGLRGMFRQAGGVLGTSLILLILSFYPDKSVGFRVIFTGMAVFLLAAAPFIKKVPDGRGCLKKENRLVD
ncbi:MAG: MFS transporter [Armatimonadetes bacterium]|nr:MFS transporter [Armatimonadota bacterium]